MVNAKSGLMALIVIQGAGSRDQAKEDHAPKSWPSYIVRIHYENKGLHMRLTLTDTLMLHTHTACMRPHTDNTTRELT